jgi:Uma2 family endonuclease
MAASSASHGWTIDRLHQLPGDGNRYEIIDGVLFVTPSPLPVHQYVAVHLCALLLPYCESVGLQLLSAPADLIVSDTTLVQPDLFVVPRRADGTPPLSYREMERPVLVIEIASPSTVRVDRGQKRALFHRMEVPEYWIADAAARTVERERHPGQSVDTLRALLTWHPIPTVDPLNVDLQQFFRSVYGE